MTTRTYPHQQTGHIYDVTDNYDADDSRHFTYDRWYRLSRFEVSSVRDAQQPSRKLEWTYDNYGNILTRGHYDPNNCQAPSYMCTASYSVDASTNRLTRINRITWEYYSWDAAGNMTSKGAFDAENRVTSSGSVSYLYDGHSRRLRTLSGGTKLYFVYSLDGRLLVEDNWTSGTARNQVYFNRQLVATHDNLDYVRLLMKDHLGSTRSVILVEPRPGGPDWGDKWGEVWETVAVYEYDPYGLQSSYVVDPAGRHLFTGRSATTTASTTSGPGTTSRSPAPPSTRSGGFRRIP